jgi:primosomal replication protein N
MKETQITRGNNVWLSGTITAELRQDKNLGEDEYLTQISVKRLSSSTDVISLVLNKKLAENIKLGDEVNLHGEFRSSNKIENGRSRLVLYVYATEFVNVDNNNPNLIELSGYICKAPIYRLTPFNREITDLLIASNRLDGKSDYLPAIAWGKNAHITQNMKVGDLINISGRIQSREYQKRQPDGSTETRTAYEISINKIVGQIEEEELYFRCE